MEVYINEKVNFNGKTCLALGSFDAIHKAHQILINTAVEYGKKFNVKSGVYQFVSRPASVLKPQNSKSLCTNEQKVRILERLGLDFTYFEEFNEKFMKIQCEDFAKMLKDKFNVACVVVGFHYRFGYRAEGDCNKLKYFGEKYGFEVIVVPPVKCGGVLISSTHIRNLVLQGNFYEAKKFLGRDYSIFLPVVHGRKVGTNVLKIPTANFNSDIDIVLPPNGVYATYIVINNKKHLSVTNIGTCPTFGLTKTTIESHIQDFEGDLYDKKIELFFIEKLRDEIKFENSDQLKRQILSDIDKAKELFCKNR